MAIDRNSSTWKTVEHWIAEQREQAVMKLIADQSSEQQRGALKCLDALNELATPRTSKITTSSGQY